LYADRGTHSKSRVVFDQPPGATPPTEMRVLPKRWSWTQTAGKWLLCTIMPDWDREQAACKGHEDIYLHNDEREYTNDHRAWMDSKCDTSPVFKSCREWAIAHEDFGYWAGTTAGERREERKERGIRCVEPLWQARYGLGRDPLERMYPETCSKGHVLKPQYDLQGGSLDVTSPHKRVFQVDCSQCYYEMWESPEAKQRQRLKAQKAAATRWSES
jgi:hypothetical protein